jgi:hypothetical protein
MIEWNDRCEMNDWMKRSLRNEWSNETIAENEWSNETIAEKWMIRWFSPKSNLFADSGFVDDCEELRIVEFVCDVERRHSDTAKMIKILNWLFCQNVVDVREFIEICVFYRVFIADFVFIAQSIYALLKKNVSFVWKFVQQKAMNILKIVFINFFVLISIDYAIDLVILAMNASLEDWRKISMILRNEKKHLMRYESDI